MVVAGGVTPTPLDASAEPVGRDGTEESLGEAETDPPGVAESVGGVDCVGGAVSVGAAEPLGHAVGAPVSLKQPVSLALGDAEADSLGDSEADSLGDAEPVGQAVGAPVGLWQPVSLALGEADPLGEADSLGDSEADSLGDAVPQTWPMQGSEEPCVWRALLAPMAGARDSIRRTPAAATASRAGRAIDGADLDWFDSISSAPMTVG